MKKEQINDFHDKLMDFVINYLRDNNIDNVDIISFSVDGLNMSVKHGEWIPFTDSSLSVYDENKTLINYSM